MAKYNIDWSPKTEFPFAKRAEESAVIETVDSGQTEFDQDESIQTETENVAEEETDGE